MWALARFTDETLRARTGAQLGKLASLLITVGFAIALPFAARGSAGDASDIVVIAALRWLTWVAASAIALSAVGARDDSAPARELALARGHSSAAFALAESIAAGRRVLWVVGTPACLLGLLAVGCSRSLALVGVRLLLLLGALAYVVALALLVAVLARVSRDVAPTRPRTALLLLVVLPHLVHGIFPRVPSVPAFSSFLLHHLSGLGAIIQ